MITQWTTKAVRELTQTLEYWTKRNGTDTYAKKITTAIKITEKQLCADPIALSFYIEDYDIYRKSLLKGKFYLFYKIDEKEDIIHILRFRSVKQMPLYE